MFNPFAKKTVGDVVTFKIGGMHCTSCSMNIDGELEDTEGVISATTSYAKGETVVHFDSKKVSELKLRKIIEGLEYQVTKK